MVTSLIHLIHRRSYKKRVPCVPFMVLGVLKGFSDRERSNMKHISNTKGGMAVTSKWRAT